MLDKSQPASNSIVRVSGGVVPESPAWLVLTLTFFSQTSANVGMLCFGPLAPFLQDSFNISRSQVGMFVTASYLGVFLFGLLFGWLIDRFGARRFVLLGPSVLGVFLIAAAWSPSFTVAIVLVTLAGFGYTFVSPALNKILVYRFSSRSRATVISFKQAGLTVGGAIAAAILPPIALALDWQWAIAVAGVIAIAGGLLCFALLPESPAEKSSRGQPLKVGDMRQVLKNRNIVLLGVLTIFYTALQLSLSTYLVLYLKEVFTFSVVAAGISLTAVSLSGALGRVTWGALSDKLFTGKRKPAMVVIGFASAITAMTLAFAPAAAPQWLILIAVIVLGFSAMGYNGVMLTFGAELVGMERAGMGTGVVLGVCIIGNLAGPPIFGHIVDITHSYSPAWFIFGASVLVAAVFILLLIREPGNHEGR